MICVFCQVATALLHNIPTRRILPAMANDDLARDQRAYIASVLERLGSGWDQTKLARKAGMEPSTLSRFMSGGREGHLLRHSSIRKIESLTGFMFLAGKGNRAAEGSPRPPSSPGFAEMEATPLRQNDTGHYDGVVEAAIAGRNNVDAWVLRSRALEGAGCRPGDTLIVELGAEPRRGDIVCAQIYDWARAGAETVFRLFEPPALIAVTTDAALLRPWTLSDSAVTIKGVVTHVLRERVAA